MQLTDWQLRFDAEDQGRDQTWFGPATSAQADTAWQSVSVPGAWNQQFGDDTPDIAWYRACVVLDAEAGHRWWLDFDAACTHVEAWCNGQPVGQHEGNWEPFAFEMPAAAGRAEIVLRVDRVRPAPAIQRGERLIEQGHITKGFHDVLSRQPAGLWQPVTLRRTGPAAIRPLGIGVIADPGEQHVTIDLDIDGAETAPAAAIKLLDPTGLCVSESNLTLSSPCDDRPTRLTLKTPNPIAWSPQEPNLYTLEVELLDASGQRSDAKTVRFGFRTLRTRDRRILLNGQPIHLSAMLDWGHEPMQTAPSPSEAELRRRLLALKAMGFNCICICLWYPPQRFYELCDELGMLVWQEHPIWKPEMTPANRPAFKQHYERFFRLDRNHPSVVIVSGACEHDAFDPDIAQWWWDRARALLPDRLLQVQTAFLRLVPPGQTDLYDEHTYENSGRWPEFLSDMDRALSAREPKPFVMGESVLYNDWPDVPGLLAVVGDDRPWWISRVLDDAQSVEAWIVERFGPDLLERFRRDARAWHLAGRKWQTEVFRHHVSHAGLVQNSLRDVAQCPLGFMDDLDQFRFRPDQTRPWLAGNALLLKTGGMLCAQPAGRPLSLSLGVSVFGETTLGTSLDAQLACPSIGWELADRATLKPEHGRVNWIQLETELPPVDQPRLLNVSAKLTGAADNRWRLWILPPCPPTPADVCVLPGSAEPPALTFEERAYSSGWGLAVETWQMVHPRPETLLPDARHWDPRSDDPRLLVCSTLTDAVIDWLDRGGRVLHLPDGLPGSLRTRIPTLWGQSPLIPPAGPLNDTDSRWLLDVLDRDLHHRWIRTIPTGQLGIADRVDPYIRLLHTHNAIGKIDICDDLFAAHVGRGLLAVSALDHTTPAGQFLLHRLIAWLTGAEPKVDAHLSADELARLRLDREAAIVTSA